jgi:hypothetical protein
LIACPPSGSGRSLRRVVGDQSLGNKVKNA